MNKKWLGGWQQPTEKELAKRKAWRQLRLERRRKALDVLATLKKSDAAIIVAGLRNCSRHAARMWLREMKTE